MSLKKLAISLAIASTSLTAVAADSPLKYPWYEEQVSSMENNFRNTMMVSDSGIASLQLRLDMIKRAKKSIEVEYFIYNKDQAGRILTQALVEAAKRGVKVRMLVDKSLPVFALDAHIAKELEEHGVDLRFYNDASTLQISTANFRSHRKLFVVDDIEAITGGRNIGDEYFDLSEKFNFLDRDVYVKGSIVKGMRESFDGYFDHKVTEDPKHPIFPRKITASVNKARRRALKRQHKQRVKNFKEAQAFAKDFITPNDKDREIVQKVEEISRPILEAKKYYDCPQTTYAADVPGARFSKRIESDFTDKYRVLRKVLADKLENVSNEILVSSPYFIHNTHTKSLMDSMIEKEIDIEIYTNSLGSTDAVYVAANFYADVFNWQKAGVVPYIHSGKWYDDGNPTISEGIKTAKWGTHSKTQVYDANEVMIGTYNVDNRSNFYNSEMGIFCKGNFELTKEVTDSIRNRTKDGYKIIGDKKAVDNNEIETDVYGNPTGMSKFIMRAIAIPSILLKDLL